MAWSKEQEQKDLLAHETQRATQNAKLVEFWKGQHDRQQQCVRRINDLSSRYEKLAEGELRSALETIFWDCQKTMAGEPAPKPDDRSEA